MSHSRLIAACHVVWESLDRTRLAMTRAPGRLLLAVLCLPMIMAASAGLAPGVLASSAIDQELSVLNRAATIQGGASVRASPVTELHVHTASTVNARVTAALPAAARSSCRPSQGFSWPVLEENPRVIQGFDPPEVRWGRGHRGVDLAASAQAQVLAAGAGRVIFAGTVAGKPVISIEHSSGLRTTYEPVEAQVAAGDQVETGDVLGTLREGHRGDGQTALHWGAKWGADRYVNPLRLVCPVPIRLKPLQDTSTAG